jgi:hypothetical protein
VLALNRFITVFGARRRTVAGAIHRPARRRAPRRRIERVRKLLPALCGIGIAAVVGWLVAGGSLPSAETFSVPFAPAAADRSAGGVRLHVESTPSDAAVRIDRTPRGKTPLDIWLAPGQHALGLQHPDALDDDLPIDIPDSGANVDVGLWRRRPDVLPVRPVYPGAVLVDARFLDDGQIVLLVDSPGRTGEAGSNRELWRLDLTTTRLTRVGLPLQSGPASTIVLAPSGVWAAYVVPGTTSDVSASLWPKSGTLARSEAEVRPDSVWVAPVVGPQPPRHIFDLPPMRAGAAGDPERIVDLVWTPDGSRLVAITRQTGPSTGARIFLVNAFAANAADADSQPTANQPVADQLVLLPAEVLPGSTVPDPTGRWLALVARAATAPGGNSILCVLELQPGGTFRDVADLGSTGTGPLAPVAWPLDAGSTGANRLVFVGPATVAASSGGGLFGIFGTLGAARTAAPPSGLFMADLRASRLEDAQPRRLGTAINNFALGWRSQTTLYSFAREDDGTLALHSVDPTSGAVHDLAVRLPAGTAQGVGGLSVRWDARHGNTLLLAHKADGGSSGLAPSGGPLQGWLVSFVSAKPQPVLVP